MDSQAFVGMILRRFHGVGVKQPSASVLVASVDIVTQQKGRLWLSELHDDAVNCCVVRDVYGSSLPAIPEERASAKGPCRITTDSEPISNRTARLPPQQPWQEIIVRLSNLFTSV